MPQEISNNVNIVHLEGTVFSCKTTGIGEGAVRAEMKVCTAKPKKESGQLRFSNPLLHRVVVCASGDKAQRLLNIEASLAEKSAENGQESPMPLKDIVAIDGKIAVNKNGQPFVLVDDERISFPKKLTMKNFITLQGKVMETSSNVAYASAKIAVKNPIDKGQDVMIPVCIYSGDNPKKFADLSQGRVKPGEILSVKGPLISKTYSAGDKTKFICSVNINNYEVLSLKQTKTKKTQVGM